MTFGDFVLGLAVFVFVGFFFYMPFAALAMDIGIDDPIAALVVGAIAFYYIICKPVFKKSPRIDD